MATPAGADQPVVDEDLLDQRETTHESLAVSTSAQAVEKLTDVGWESLDDVEGPLWTDDYSSIVTVLK